jgi:hypothetical protein
VTRSSQPCQSSWPQNGQDMRAPRLRKKSKMGGFAVIRFATVAHRPSAPAQGQSPSRRSRPAGSVRQCPPGEALVEYPRRLLLMSL